MWLGPGRWWAVSRGLEDLPFTWQQWPPCAYCVPSHMLVMEVEVAKGQTWSLPPTPLCHVETDPAGVGPWEALEPQGPSLSARGAEGLRAQLWSPQARCGCWHQDGQKSGHRALRAGIQGGLCATLGSGGGDEPVRPTCRPGPTGCWEGRGEHLSMDVPPGAAPGFLPPPKQTQTGL